jgi:acyl-CoA synthetase (NDP forming)
MTMTRLERLFRPKSVAAIGGAPAALVVAQCRKMGFSGEIWPVHPTKDEIEGYRCYRSVDDLPGAPDAAFVGVNRRLTIDVVKSLSARGAGGAVCYASGFREVISPDSEGLALERALLDAAGDMPFLGPNCYGLINYGDGALLWPDQQGGRRLGKDERGVAVLMQSSNIAINVTMQARGLPIAYMVTVGNQAQTKMADIAADLLDDARVTCLGLHIEGVGDARALEALALKARKLQKPIIAIKVGRSPQAQAATLSHTASLAGGDAATEALLARLGIARVSSLPELIESLKLCHIHGALPGFEAASMSCSGGEASVIADAALPTRIRFSPFPARSQTAIEKSLGPLVAVANPLDYQTYVWNDEKALETTFSAVLGAGADLTYLVLDYPRADRCDPKDWFVTERAFASAAKATGARGALVAALPENLPEDRIAHLFNLGLAPLQGLDEALKAAEASARVGEAWRAEPPPPLFLPPPVEEAEAETLNEARGKAELALYGVPVPMGRLAATPKEAADAADALGYPVALKGLGVAHKTEAGAVKLNLKDRAQVLAAAEAMQGLGEGFLVEAMVSPPVAELIVGVSRDPVAGLLMTVGAGGILVELLGDAASFLLPPREGEIAKALSSLKTAPLLTGFRGRPVADLPAAVAAIEAIARYAVDEGDALLELDVNPLMVGAVGQGATAADVLIRRARKQA